MYFFKLDTVPLACRLDPEEGISLLRGHAREEGASMHERCSRAFVVAVLLIGSVISISSLIYYLYIIYHTSSAFNSQAIILPLFSSVLFVVMLCILCDNRCCSNNRQRTVTAVPVRVASLEDVRDAFRWSPSERALTEAVERENLTWSWLIQLPVDQMQAHEQIQTDSKEASTETVVKAPVTTAAPVQPPKITVSEVETLPRDSDGSSSEIPATETAPSNATETAPSNATETAPSKATETAPSKATETAPSKATHEEGVRQRKVTPPEEQKYEPVQENAN